MIIVIKFDFSVIDHCEPDPCVHGRCHNRLTGYTCDCDSGYEGNNCELGNILKQENVFTTVYMSKLSSLYIVQKIHRDVCYLETCGSSALRRLILPKKHLLYIMR